MNTETNRLAQIIGSAADKYRGLAGLQPTEQDKVAAQAIEAEYLFIHRNEIPKTAIIERDGKPHVEVDGSDAGTWPMGHPKNNAANNRRYGLEYLAASIAIQEWHDERESALGKRRDELAVELFGIPHYERIGHYSFADNHRRAIDRIIELEGQTDTK